MKTYKNEYLTIRIDVPDTWNICSWRNTKFNRVLKSLYQSSDDDKPGKNGHKLLFTAELRNPLYEAMLDASIELSIVHCPYQKSIRSSIIENHERMRQGYKNNGIICSITMEGTWAIDGKNFSYIDTVSKSRDNESWS